MLITNTANVFAGSQNSQGPPLFSQAVLQAGDARYSPQAVHNAFIQQAEAEAGKVARRLPSVTMYRSTKLSNIPEKIAIIIAGVVSYCIMQHLMEAHTFDPWESVQCRFGRHMSIQSA